MTAAVSGIPGTALVFCRTSMPRTFFRTQRASRLLRVQTELEVFVARRLLRIAHRVRPMLSPKTVDGHTLDPEVQWLLHLIRVSGRDALDELDIAEARRQYAMLPRICEAPPCPIAEVVDLSVRAKTHSLAVRIYADRPGPLPVLVFFHGGGGVVGDLETHDGLCRRLAKQAQVAVVAVDYRLAPENPWPAAVEDAHAAFVWVVDNASRLGFDRDKIAVGGDSLGGCLAAVVAQRHASPKPCFQLLIYPATDAVTPTPSRQSLREGYLLTGAMIAWFGRHYFGGADPTDPAASPGLATELAHVPPALVVTAGFDPLRDEADEYANELEAVGVRVDRRCYRGLPHGFVHLTGVVGAAGAAIDDIAAALRAELSR